MSNDYINVERLGKLNLNLVPSLYALLETKSVSASALMLRVSQPTMSRNLGQLRKIFQDTLLVRISGRCSLTVKAQKLLPLVKQLVFSAEALADMTISSPADSQYSVALPQYVIERYSSQLMSCLYQEALGNKVILKVCDENTLKRTMEGEYDLAIMPQKQGCSSNPAASIVYSEQVITSIMGVLVLDSHPLARREMAYSDLKQYPLYSLSNTLDSFFLDYKKNYLLGHINKTIYPAFNVLQGMMQAGRGMMLTTGNHGYSANGRKYKSSKCLEKPEHSSDCAVANGAMIVAGNRAIASI